MSLDPYREVPFCSMGALFPEIPGLLEEPFELDFDSLDSNPAVVAGATPQELGTNNLSLEFTPDDPTETENLPITKTVQQETRRDLLSVEAQAQIIKEHFPTLLVIFSDTKEFLPAPFRSMKCDLQQGVSCLTLEHQVELGYMSLFIQIALTKKEKSAKNGKLDSASKNVDAQMEIAAQLIQILIDKSWLHSSNQKEKTSRLQQLSELYFKFGVSRGLDPDKLNRMNKDLDSLHQLSALSACDCYKEPVLKTASKDRRIAILYFNAMIQAAADFVPQVCMVISSELNKVVGAITKRNHVVYGNARTKNMYSDSGAVVSPDQLERQKALDLALGRIEGRIARVIKSYIEKLKQLKDVVPHLGASKDPLEQFIQIKELLAQGKNLRTIAKILPEYQKQLLGVFGWFSNLYGFEDPVSGLPKKIFERFTTAHAHFYKKLAQRLILLAKKHETQFKEIIVNRADIEGLIVDYISSGEGVTYRLELMRLGISAEFLDELKDILNKLCSDIVLELDTGLRACQQEAFSEVTPSCVSREILEKGERCEIAKEIQAKSSGHRESDEGRRLFSQVLELVSTSAMQKARQKETEIDDTDKFNAFYSQTRRGIRDGIKSRFSNSQEMLLEAALTCEHLYSVSVNVSKVECALKFLSESPFLMLEKAIFSVLNWREAIDIETPDNVPSFEDPIFEDEKGDSKGVDKPIKGKRRALLTKNESPKQLPAAKMGIASSPVVTVQSVENGVSTPLSEFATVMNRILEVPDGLAPMHVLGKHLPRERTAQLDQAFAFHCVDIITEMLQFKNVPQSARYSLAGVLGLEIYHAVERRETADLLKLKSLRHHLKWLREKLGRSIRGHLVLDMLPMETILFRYSERADIEREKNVLRKSPDLVKDLVSLLSESLPSGSADGMLKKLDALADSFEKRIDMGGSLTQEQIKKLVELEAQLKSTSEGMVKALHNLGKSERTEFLTHISKHVWRLRQIPSVIMHCPNQKYLMIPALMLLLSGQYAVENLGLLCAWKAGKRQVVLSMGDELHDLLAYDKFGLFLPLKERENVVKLLNAGKAGEEIFRCCSELTNESSVSDLVKLISQLYEWSRAAANNEGVWAPRGIAQEPAKVFAEIQERLVKMTLEICQMVDALVKSHV